MLRVILEVHFVCLVLLAAFRTDTVTCEPKKKTTAAAKDIQTQDAAQSAAMC